MSESKTEQMNPDRQRQHSHRSLAWTLGLFFSIVIIVAGLAVFVLTEPNLDHQSTMALSLRLIGFLYPEANDSGSLVALARDAVFKNLDRYSGYLEPRELEQITEEFSGSYGGIGITIVAHPRGLMVMSVREGGPADRVGICIGDVIIRADTAELAGINAYLASFMLRGPEGTGISLDVARDNMADTLTFILTRERLKLIHVPYAGFTPSGAFYIRMLDFEAGAAFELAEILDTLFPGGEDSITGIILDLRGNPGGLLNEAVAIADIFLDEGFLIVGTKGRSRWQDETFHSTGNDVTGGLPMAIIVDRGSASASEIVSGALKYAGRAVLVGDTTFGKGLVQEHKGLGDGSGIRLTTSRYYFEGGIFLNDPEAPIDSAAGIPPDYCLLPMERKAFPRLLENSLLMRQFATAQRDEILLGPGLTGPSPEWFGEFVAYVRRSDFSYESELTELVRYTKDHVILRNSRDATVRAVKRLLALAREDDSRQIYEYRDYIKQRLYQIAVESKYGLARAYQDVIVPFRPEIRLAEKILSGLAAGAGEGSP
ncbi:MAG: PDZ domain-containing protein [Candidatus Zixiibacteriota bacterium]|nr:MAG: PDZ domain-containing protein [candidate division Zixibacteria bacterium]